MKHPGFIFRARFFACSLGTFVLALYCPATAAQGCPENIDFETGTFQGWSCHVGFVTEQGNNNVITLYPFGREAYNRHTLYTSTPGNGLDAYGKFPVNCPNGSGHSVRLGNEQGGALAEGLSYEFTIPAYRDRFTIIYHYAIVFQESPHLEHQQPRFEVEVTNVTKGERIGCSSFKFRPFGPLTPGFAIAKDAVSDVPVWYKDWTPVAINLNGHAGETVQLFFKVSDCTYFDHFGYAYIDVDSECSGEFTAAKYCVDDTLITLTAPAGYQHYTWYDSLFTQVLSTGQTLSLLPQDALGSSIPVQVTPFYGYGCVETLYAKVGDTLSVQANAGEDILTCNNAAVTIGSSPDPGLVYSWMPRQGLSDPAVSNPLANPDSSTAYVLTVNSSGGGCLDRDTVFVNTTSVSDSLQVTGSLDYCLPNTSNPLLLRVQQADSIQWFRNSVEINGADKAEYKPTQSGTYYAVLFNREGCSAITPQKTVHIEQQQPGITYPVKYAVARIPTDLETRKFGSMVLWKPSSYLNDAGSVSPVFTGNTDQLYTIDIQTSAGCKTVDTQMVKIIPDADIRVPTAFTPDGNGLNDMLRPLLLGIKELRYFKIFNRSGRLLFQTKDASVGWDGKVKATSASSQVVVWVAEGMGWDNKVYFRKGTSTILR